MLRETIGVLAIVNVALCLVPAGAYLFELPNKLVRRAGWTCMVRAWGESDGWGLWIEGHCHCEERSDEAIPRRLNNMARDCFVAALLAMTVGVNVSQGSIC